VAAYYRGLLHIGHGLVLVWECAEGLCVFAGATGFITSSRACTRQEPVYQNFDLKPLIIWAMMVGKDFAFA
jgi:hypothetical protein